MKEISLEEIINKTKLLGKRFLIRTLMIPMIFANSLFINCGKKEDSNPIGPEQNIPPQTEIVKGPSSTINTDNVTFEWRGTDEDGYIVRYKHKLSPLDSDYTNTTNTTKTFINLQNNSYTFKVSAQDDDGEWDPTEATRSFTVNLENIITGGDIKAGTTNSSGEITFIDNSDNEGVTVNVVNSDGDPLSGKDVTYFDGDGVEVFLVTDPNKEYLPEIEFYPHNSSQLITMSLAGSSGYGVETVTNSNTINVAQKFVNSQIIENGTGDECDLSNYVGTMIGDDYYNYMQIRIGINMFFLNQLGLGNMLKIVKSVDNVSTNLANVLGIQTPEQYIKSNNWDLYALTPSNLVTTTIYADMVSNRPIVNLSNPAVNGDDVTISWDTYDATTYEGISYLKDATICLGSTENSDLNHTIKLYKVGEQGIFNTFPNSESPKTIYNLDNNNYSVIVTSKDEVNNTDDSYRKYFTISTEQDLDSLVIQPGPEGKDARVEIYWQGTNYSHSDLNHGDETHLYIGYAPTVTSESYYLNRAYIQFPIEQIPSGKQIQNATLNIYHFNPSFLGTHDYDVHVIMNYWNEEGITWDNQPTIAEIAYRGFQVHFQSTTHPNWVEGIDITSLVRAWYNGNNQNYGIVLKAREESPVWGSGGTHSSFTTTSSDYTGDTTLRPKLVVKYTD